MTPMSHWMARAAAIAIAVIVPILVLAGPAPRKPPASQMIATGRPPPIAAATPDVGALPMLFETAPSLVPIDGETARPMLVGVAGRLPDDAEAMIRLPGEPTRAIRRGDTVMGWTLTAIAADRAVFSRGQEQHVSTLAPDP